MKPFLRFATVLSVLWVLIAVTVVLEDSFSASRFVSTFMIVCAIPLSALWGIGWIIAGVRKKTQLPQSETSQPIAAPQIKTRSFDDPKVKRRSRAVMVAGWLLAILFSFAVFRQSETGMRVPQSNAFAYAIGAAVMPLTALAAGISSFRRLRSAGSALLVGYSVVLLIVLGFRIFG